MCVVVMNDSSIYILQLHNVCYSNEWLKYIYIAACTMCVVVTQVHVTACVMCGVLRLHNVCY